MQIEYKLFDKYKRQINIGDVIKEIKIPNRRNGDETPHTNYYKVAFGEFHQGYDDWGINYEAVGFHVKFPGKGTYALIQGSKDKVYAIQACNCEIVNDEDEIPKEFL